MTVEIICADAREALAAMPEGSVHACITSPPYWGLRDYGLELVVWGEPVEPCEHEWGEHWTAKTQVYKRDAGHKPLDPAISPRTCEPRHQGDTCRRCSAWRGTLGLEPTPELYVEHIVQVMREVRRVLRDDGTLWLNLGDSYSAASTHAGRDKAGIHAHGEESAKALRGRNREFQDGLKPKDLCGMPWRVAFALQADGWWLRSDIVWSKPNPMPESVRDRPTRSHEYVFLLSKSARYYYDQDAIREPAIYPDDDRKARARNDQKRYPTSEVAGIRARKTEKQRGHGRRHVGFNDRWDAMSRAGQQAGGRNRRSVWEIATQPYPGAHFAVFPEKLVEPCILAGCPGGGTVLDPFAGSGTVGLVAERLGRHSILIDASEDYCRMARERTAQMGLMEAAR